MEGADSTMIHCKNFGKCHNVAPDLKKKKFLSQWMGIFAGFFHFLQKANTSV
jgi:hypothetical protein